MLLVFTPGDNWPQKGRKKVQWPSADTLEHQLDMTLDSFQGDLINFYTNSMCHRATHQ